MKPGDLVFVWRGLALGWASAIILDQHVHAAGFIVRPVDSWSSFFVPLHDIRTEDEHASITLAQ